MKYLGAALALYVAMLGSASASTIFSENFSGGTPGTYGGAIPGTGFAVTSGNVDVLGVLNGSNFACVNNPGGNCLDLIGNVGVGAIASTTTFNLLVGHSYTLTFNDILQGGDTLPSELFNVSLGSLVRSETSLSTGASSVTEIFTPASEQDGATLDFISVTNDDGVHGPVLDSIVLTDALVATTPVGAVPEPGTLALMGAGIVGLGFLRRRKAA
jgi:hypothetical protein